jgi:hypothetical protein
MIFDFIGLTITFLRAEVVGATELVFRKDMNRRECTDGLEVELQAGSHVGEKLFGFLFHDMLFFTFDFFE